MQDKNMSTTRIEAFSDAVIAIIITIMVLEMRAPRGTSLNELFAIWPVFLSYILSFLVLAIYWVNHHQMLRLAKRADNAVLWTNNLLLFCLSLTPFATAYMGENHFEPLPTALYAIVLLSSSLSYFALWTAIMRHHKDELGFEALCRSAFRKNIVSVGLYTISVPLAFVHPALTIGIAFLIEAIYFIPEIWLREA
jgi:uncharacterized membrane protein